MLRDELYFEPRKAIRQLKLDDYIEMTEFESAFLCGLIRKFRPKNILEVGVAGGGTTAILEEVIDLLDMNDESKLWSVDISEGYYRDKSKKSGFMADMVTTKKEVNREMLLGKYLPERLPEISKRDKIDFVILDTVHKTPGEMLDFLSIYPYLSANACVVLHDIGAQHYWGDTTTFATQLVLSTVTGDVIIMEDTDRMLRYPNIGAFVVNEDTKKYIFNIFCALTLPWHYMPNQREIEIYRKSYEAFYDQRCLRMYDLAVGLHKNNFVPVSDYELGSIVYFDDKHHDAIDYCMQGISVIEKNFAWTDGGSLIMGFHFSRSFSKLKMEIDCGPYFHDQRVNISANGNFIKEICVAQRGKYSFDIDGEYCMDGRLVLNMELLDAISPYKAQGMDDRRVLALQMFSMMIKNID